MEKTVTLEEALKRIEELEKENAELQVLPFSPLPCPPFMSFSFCLYYKYLCYFSQSDYVMLHHFLQ